MNEQALVSDELAYKKIIEILIKLESKEIIDNKDANHCRILLHSLIEKITPKKYIGIFTGSLEEGIYTKDIIDALKTRLDTRINIKLLFQLKPTNFSSSLFYKELLAPKTYEDLIHIRVLKDKYATYDHHMLSINRQACRLEMDHALKTAKASFFNESLGGPVRKTFESLFNSDYSDPLEV